MAESTTSITGGANLLAPPVIDVVLSAMVRDEAQKRAASEAEEDA